MKPKDSVPDGIKKIIETENRLKRATQPLSNMCRINDAFANTIGAIPKYEDPLADLKADLRNMCVATGIDTIADGIISAKSPLQNLTFPLQKLQIHTGAEAFLNPFKEATSILVNDTTKNIIANSVMTFADAIKSPFKDWFTSVEITPLKQLADILEINYEKLKNYCFDIMYKCEWCPYIVVIADRGLINEIFEILETSREKSKRQQQRIDKAVISYCTDARIKQIKSKWKNADLDGKHFNKMIAQTIDAYLRKEYALTISCLATMWEGLIHKKANVTGRQKMELTKKDFAKLIDENDYKPILSDYFNDFIVKQCDGVADVKDGVPNRHGVSHSWYNKYPNKKAALNAILLTDFILELEPLESEGL